MDEAYLDLLGRIERLEEQQASLVWQLDQQTQALTQIEGMLELIRLEIQRIAGGAQTWRN